MWKVFTSSRMTFRPISSLWVATKRVNSWFKIVGRNVINELIWMAWAALRILQLSDSAGRAAVLGKSSSRSAWRKRLCKCWSVVITVESSRKVIVKICRWLSIHWISGPAFCWRDGSFVACGHLRAAMRRETEKRARLDFYWLILCVLCEDRISVLGVWSDFNDKQEYTWE